MIRKRGGITVFLSLSGVLVFALLGTLVETARYTVCKNHVARTVQTAAEGLLTEYSLPLYEQYRLFFMESGGTPYEQVIAGYAGDTMEAAGKGNKDFLAGHVTNVEIRHRRYLGDDEAMALQEEISAYMGRELTKEALEKVLKKSSQLNHVEEQAKQMEETLEKEKKEAELDQHLLKLMSYVDGISVSHGTITCVDNFVKSFATGEKKGQNFSITESAVWEKMKSHITEETRNWDIADKNAFLSRVANVKKNTAQAIQAGRKLKSEYQKIGISPNEDKDMIQRVVAALPCLETNQKILEETETLLGSHPVRDVESQLTQLWKDYDTKSIAFDYTGVQEKGGADNPKDSFSSAWDKGILNLVCKEGKELSEKSIPNPDSYADFYGSQEKKAEFENRVSDFTKEDTMKLSGTLGDMGNYAMEEFCLDCYIQKMFGNYTEKKTGWKQALEYGLEYVVAGEGSDIDNLKSVLNRILLLRSVVNFMAVYQDSGKRGEAEAAAIAVVGFTGLQPLIALVKTLILMTWALVESLVDIAGLLMGKQVPVIKKPSDVTTNFAEVFLINRQAITKRASSLKKAGKSSFGYKEYLLLFLAATKQSTRRYRVMDLIEHNMHINGYKGFQLGMCVHDIRVRATISFQAQFFRLALLEKITGRSLQNYSITGEVEAGY